MCHTGHTTEFETGNSSLEPWEFWMLFASLLCVWLFVVAYLADQNMLFILYDKTCQRAGWWPDVLMEMASDCEDWTTGGWSHCPSLLKWGEVFQDYIF